MRRRAARTALALGLACAGCGDGPARQERSATASTAAQPVPDAPAASRPPLDPASERALIAGVAASVLAQSRQALVEQLIRSSALVESPDELHFDGPSRTLVVAVTSVPHQDDRTRSALAHELARRFAPLLWGSQATGTVRSGSLALFAVRVDSVSFRCSGTTMAALAEGGLSRSSFVERCRP